MRLGFGRDNGYSLTFYCEGYTTRNECRGWPANWDQLIQYFGLEADIVTVRTRALRSVECPACGRPADTMTLHPPEKNPGEPWRAWDWQKRLDEPLSPDEAEWAREREEHRRLMAIYSEARRVKDQAISDKEAARQKEAKRLQDARDKGIFLIGPPNPHQFKKQRPTMKG